MKRLLRILFIVACLVGVAYHLFHSPCPLAHRIIAHWEKDAEDYHAGRISFDELIYRSDRLIECSEKCRAYLLELQPNRRRMARHNLYLHTDRMRTDVHKVHKRQRQLHREKTRRRQLSMV